MKNKNLGAIILAAGKGTRFGGQKQFIKINDEMLWEIVYNKIINYTYPENIVVVGVDCHGGKTRSDSVKIGLNKLPKNIEKVIILESARPLITCNQIETLLSCKTKSISFYMDLVDTVIGKSGIYLERSDYCNLQTPQCFDFKLLLDAYNTNKFKDTTDETRVIFEQYNIKPTLIEGGTNLIKITYKDDYDIILKMISEKR